MSARRLIAVITAGNGLAEPDVQQSALAAAGVVADEVAVISPQTWEDWDRELGSIIESLAPGDTIAVAALTSLGLGSQALLESLRSITAASASLVSAAEDIDTRKDDAFLVAVVTLLGAIEAGQDAKTRRLLTTAVPGEAKTPPQARFVELDSYRRATA